MASGDQHNLPNSEAGEAVQKEVECREDSIDKKVAKDRDEKLKIARERQNEERQRKIEELKVQAEAAQRYREQKEDERRRRIDEIRHRDSEKRHQVEERKRAIMEAEKERREYILRKNQERESRLETKRRDRNAFGFAFGSSTPRLLEPAEFGTVSPSTFLGHRRSTSISNVAGASLTRRSSERELADSGTKKRATSASGTDRNDEDMVGSTQVLFRSVARRKTDLMPTIPSPRDGHYGSRTSLSNTPRTPGSRSGNVTPGGSINTSRPGSAMSTSTNMTTSGSVARRLVPAVRKPRPASIAGTGISLEEINKLKKENKPPVKTSTPSSVQTTPKRTSNIMSTSMITTSSSRMSSAEKNLLSKKESLTPKSSTPKSLIKTTSSDRIYRQSNDKLKDTNELLSNSSTVMSANNTNASGSSELLDSTAKIINVAPALNSVKTDQSISDQPEALIDEKKEQEIEINQTETNIDTNIKNRNDISNSNELTTLIQVDGNESMTASMIAKNKITTEEEAKAALAERRRLAREEAERQAELERQRQEAIRLEELKRQEEEIERQRLFEEEAMYLAKEQRKAEEERLRQAIEEAKQREEEERLKREEEENQRIERDEVEKKAKEDAEKQKIEVAERLKREEKEREERRKRVEAIMSRTRKGSSANTPNSTPVKDKESHEPEITPTNNIHNKQQQSVTTSSESSSTSGTTATTPTHISSHTLISSVEPQNSQAMYEQSVIEKEAALINSFSNMIIDENAKNLQNMPPQIVEANKLHTEFHINNTISQNSTTTVANGNGHININNKNDINILQDVVAPSSTQLIDIDIESQDINNSTNFNNNNNNLLTSTTLVPADSHESKDISLL